MELSPSYPNCRTAILEPAPNRKRRIKIATDIRHFSRCLIAFMCSSGKAAGARVDSECHLIRSLFLLNLHHTAASLFPSSELLEVSATSITHFLRQILIKRGQTIRDDGKGTRNSFITGGGDEKILKIDLRGCGE